MSVYSQDFLQEVFRLLDISNSDFVAKKLSASRTTDIWSKRGAVTEVSMTNIS